MNDAKVIQDFFLNVQLYQMNKQGKQAVIIPPCSNLPTYKHKSQKVLGKTQHKYSIKK